MLVELTISANDAGQKAERYLRKVFPRLSLDRLHSLFRRKEIKVARKPVKGGYALARGDVLQVYGLREEEISTRGLGAETASSPAVFDIPILFEDDGILVLDKPAGLAVHPGTGIAAGESVIEKARAYLAATGKAGWEEEVFRPSLAHRLDKDTSGVLVIAKTGESLRHLTAALRAGRFTKRYLALVEGVPEPAEGRLSGSLSRVDSRSGGAKAKVVAAGGKPSATRYKVVKVLGELSLLSVVIETGRMHQIRAHLAEAGHPLAGDARYGLRERNRALRKSLGLDRIFLHAADLEIGLEGGKKLAFHSPLAEDISLILRKLDSAISRST